MRTPIFVIVLACLTGCALTPREVMDRGQKYTARSSGRPEIVAGCVVRNVENEGPNIMASSTSSAGMHEVTVRAVGEGAQTLAVFQISPTTDGSTVSGAITPNLFNPNGWFDRAIRGC